METDVKPKSPMAPTAAFAHGMRRIWLHKRILLWLYLINIVFASVLVYPFRRILDKVARTDLADEFLTGFSTDAFLDIRMHVGSQLESLGYGAVGLAALYLLVTIFLTGGIVATLALDHRVSFQRFLGNAGRYFSRYLRLFVTFAVTIGALLAGYKYRLEPYLDDLAEAETTDRSAFLWQALGVVIVLFVVSLMLMVFDYAKIRTVVDRRKSMIVAAFVGLAFPLRRAWRCVRLFGMNVLIVVVIFAIFLLVGKQFSNATWGSIVGLFIVQQIFIILRIGMKLSFFASQLAMYESFVDEQDTTTTPETVSPITPVGFKPLNA